MHRLGWAIDWDREVSAHQPEYYRWTQWLFLKFFEAGLAYRKAAPVNWCPHDQTVLANEQVIDGRCELCGTEVEARNLEQWFFRITAYADALLDDHALLDWPDRTITIQRNWIGRSEGAEVLFRVDEVDLAREKTGVFTGRFATNPVNEARIPIWVADYVLMEYGTGAIMAVPEHDERDFAFAQRYELPVVPVVVPVDGEVDQGTAFMGHSENEKLVDSAQFSGMTSPEAKKGIVEWLEARRGG